MSTNYTVGVTFTGNASSLNAATKEAAAGEREVGRAGQDAGNQAVKGLQPIEGALDRVAAATKAFLGAAALVEVAKGLGNFADEYANIGAQMRQATGDTVSFGQAQDVAYGIAQRTASSLASTADLASKLTRALRDTGVDGAAAFQRAAGLTESIQQAVALSHVSVASGNAAIVQLTQGLASGVLRGADLNSVLEQTPRLAQAIADGMGVTIGQLRALGAEGKITAQSVISALTGQADVLRTEFADLPLTIELSWTQLHNAVERYVGEADQALGASGALAAGISVVADNIDVLANVGLALAIGQLGKLAAGFVAGRVASVQAALAQGALIEAELKSAQAAEAETLALLEKAKALVGVGGAIGTATEAEAAYALAQTRTAAASQAVGAASTVAAAGVSGLGRGLLALAGGWVGVTVIALGGLVYAINQSIQAERDRQKEFDAGVEQMKASTKAAQDVADAFTAIAAVPFKPLPDFSTTLKQWSDNTAVLSTRQAELADKQRELAQVNHDLAEAQNASSGYGYALATTTATLTNRSAELTREINLLQPALGALGTQTNALGVAMTSTLSPALRDAANAAHSLLATTSADSFVTGIIGQLQQVGIQAGVLKDNAKEWNATNTTLGASIQSVNDKFATYGKTTAQVIAAQFDAVKSTEVWNNATDAQRKSLTDAANAAIAHAQAMEKTKKPLDNATASTRDLARANADIASSQRTLDEQNTQLQDKLAGLTDQQIEYNTGVRDAVAAYQEWIREGVPVDQAMHALSDRYDELNDRLKLKNEIDAQSARNTPTTVKSYETQTSAAERYYQVIEQGAKSAADAVGNSLVNSLDSLGDLWHGLVDSAKQVVAQIISTWLQLRVLQPFLGSVFGGGGSGGLLGLTGTVAGELGVGLTSSGQSTTAGGGTASGSTDYAGMISNIQAVKAVYSRIFNTAGGTQGFAPADAGFNDIAIGTRALTPKPYSPYGGTANFGGGYAAPYASIGGGLLGAYYGSQRGNGGLSTAASTVSYGALGAGLAGTAAGVAGGASVGAAAGGAFGAAAGASWIPVVGWALAAIAAIDAISGGKVFGTKYQTQSADSFLDVGPDGASARSALYQKRQGALFSGAKYKTVDQAASPELVAAANQLYDSLEKTLVQGATKLGVDVPAMINANLQTHVEVNDKGQVRSTEYVVNYLGQVWKEATAEAAAQRLGAEALVSVVAASAGSVAQQIAQQFRGSADTLLDGAQTMLAAQSDINKGNSLVALGASATLSQVIKFVQGLQADGEALADTYARLQQASAAYLQFVGQFTPTSNTFGASLQAIATQMQANIDQANALAQAAGLQYAKESDLANIHTQAAQQAAAAIAQLSSAAEDLAASLYNVTGASLDAVNAQIDKLTSKVQTAAQMAIGDDSPLSDKQKLAVALQGLRSGITSEDDVLSLGRKLYSSSADYTGLYNEVQDILQLPTAQGTGAGSINGALADYNKLIAQRDKLQSQADATARFSDAKTLAQYVADISTTHGIGYGEAASGLGFSLNDLAKDLGITNISGYLDSLKLADIPGSTMDASASIVDAIRDLGRDLIATLTGGPLVTPGPTDGASTATNDPQTNALLKQLVDHLSDVSDNTKATAATNDKMAKQGARDGLLGVATTNRQA
jgi:tape measure domain-containing protein